MSYSKTFNAAWAKPKKSQVKKQTEVSVIVKPVESSSDLSNPLNTDIVPVQHEHGLLAVAPISEPQNTSEASPDDNPVSLEAAGVRTIDFAYVSHKMHTDSETHQGDHVEASSNRVTDNLSGESMATGIETIEAPTAQSTVEPPSGYAKRFSKQWSQPTRSRHEATQTPNTNGQPSSAFYNLDVASNHITSEQKLRHSTGYKRRSKDDADLTTSLDGQTVRLLREQFSADEFLAYYRGRRSRESTPASRRYDQPLVRPKDPATVRESRTSASSIGDTPPKYHRISRGSDNSDRWRRSSSNNNNP